jgi:SMP-30/Gluconolactonase/LRE-like region
LQIRTGLRANAAGLWVLPLQISDIENPQAETRRGVRDLRRQTSKNSSPETGLLAANLAMSAAAGSLAVGDGFHGVLAQAAKRIERLDSSLDAVIDTIQPIQELASSLGGELGPAEGPVWWKEGHYLLFSDIGNNRRMKYTPGQGVTVFKESTNHANGLTRDLQGRLVACEQDTRRVARQELDGGTTVIANSFQGRRLNRPNDVVVKSDGSVYFTDPMATSSPNNGTWVLRACTASVPISAP